MHPFKPQLKILDRAFSSLLCRCRALKRLGRKAFTALQRSDSGKKKKKEKVLYMSSLQLTGKCLLCARAHMRLGTCSVLRLLYKACYIFNKVVMKFAFTFLSDSFS